MRMMPAAMAALLLAAASTSPCAAEHEAGCADAPSDCGCDRCDRQPLIGLCRKEICLPKLNLPCLCDFKELFKCRKCNDCNDCAPACDSCAKPAPACDTCDSCNTCKSGCRRGCGGIDLLGLFQRRGCCGEACGGCDNGCNGGYGEAGGIMEPVPVMEETPHTEQEDAIPEPPAPAKEPEARVQRGSGSYVRIERAAEPNERAYRPASYKRSTTATPRLLNPADPNRLRHQYSPWPSY